MVTTPQTLFAVETTITPAPFGTHAGDDLRLWIPQQISVEEVPSPVTDALDDVGEDEMPETTTSPADYEDRLAAAISAQRETLETEFAERLEAEKAAAFEAGKNSLADDVAAITQRSLDAVSDLNQTKLLLAREYRQDAVTLALTLARAVVGHTLATSDDALRTIVERAIASVPAHSELLLKCNPEEKKRLDNIIPSIPTNTGDPNNVRIVETESMEPGGISIDFEDGSIDARPTTALAVLEEAVRGALAGPLDIQKLERTEPTEGEDG